MDQYVLKFIDANSASTTPDFHFQAPDASEALVIARIEASARDTELWKGGHKLCTLRAHDLGAMHRGST